MNISVRHRFLSLLLTSVSCFLAAGNQASGGYLVSDLGPGGEFDTTRGYNLTGPGNFTGQGYGLAVEFTVGPSSATFGSATLALAYRGGLNSVEIDLASDDGGLPGSALETIRLANLPTGGALVTAEASGKTLLKANTAYWLVAIATGNTTLAWFSNNQNSANHLADRLDTGSGPGPWSMASGAADPAFAISGAPSVAATVPAPSSLPLLGLGVLALIGRAARRKDRAG